MTIDEIKKAIENFLVANKEYLVLSGIFKFEVDNSQKKVQGELVNKQRLKTIKISKSS